jgi:hypothetical protein
VDRAHSIFVRDRLTTPTKRRLTLLVVALGLIAAAPQVFHVVVDLQPQLHIGRDDVWFSADSRSAAFGTSTFFGSYISSEQWGSRFGLYRPGYREVVSFHLPHESITLRVVSAAALAGGWLLVVCIRAFRRRLQRADTN